MYTILIVVAIFIVLLILTISDNENLSDMVGFSFAMLIVGLVIGFVISLLIPSKVIEESTKYPLELIHDNQSINGSFFVGSGYYQGSIEYVFYYENNGVYKLKQTDTSRTSIKYTNEKPYVEFINVVKDKNAIINKFSTSCRGCRNMRYVLHVPKGTIKQIYSLDGM